MAKLKTLTNEQLHAKAMKFTAKEIKRYNMTDPWELDGTYYSTDGSTIFFATNWTGQKGTSEGKPLVKRGNFFPENLADLIKPESLIAWMSAAKAKEISDFLKKVSSDSPFGKIVTLDHLGNWDKKDIISCNFEANPEDNKICVGRYPEVECAAISEVYHKITGLYDVANLKKIFNALVASKRDIFVSFSPAFPVKPHRKNRVEGLIFWTNYSESNADAYGVLVSAVHQDSTSTIAEEKDEYDRAQKKFDMKKHEKDWAEKAEEIFANVQSADGSILREQLLELK